MKTADAPPVDVFDATSASRAALELVANKWALLIVPALRDGPLRNNELLRRIGGISQKMLTQTLRDLERNGLVLRTDRRSVPPHVEYALSDVGRPLSEAFVAVGCWAEAHHRDLADARKAFDARNRG
ncbi:helix-turn-helix domain-containing protein [Variovorax sp. J22R24]|uniref:winged helix-turn-helix transcriptional regulator n=1 Tax=Variovorax gracilis TaxID=3053502 RepID=UPI002578C68F|nr:helix-turn-helix domain-containing protein [Variovorax sp. J22R24]MDM0107568.1 helix-turn-helix domain-containing protein [Variovorax sp. J22R24]